MNRMNEKQNSMARKKIGPCWTDNRKVKVKVKPCGMVQIIEN